MPEGPISGLPAAGALVGVEPFAVAQGGFTKRSTPNAVLALANTANALGCELGHSIAQSIPNAAWTSLAFDTEALDDAGFHDPGDNTKITIPASKAGKYIIGANVSFVANATGNRLVRILLNGATEIAVAVSPALGAGFATYLNPVAPPRRYVPTNFLQLQAYQDSTGALDVTAAVSFNIALIVLST